MFLRCVSFKNCNKIELISHKSCIYSFSYLRNYDDYFHFKVIKSSSKVPNTPSSNDKHLTWISFSRFFGNFLKHRDDIWVEKKLSFFDKRHTHHFITQTRPWVKRERKNKKNEINPNKTSFLSQNSFLYNSEEKHIIRIREKLIFGIMNAWGFLITFLFQISFQIPFLILQFK